MSLGTLWALRVAKVCELVFHVFLDMFMHGVSTGIVRCWWCIVHVRERKSVCVGKGLPQIFVRKGLSFFLVILFFRFTYGNAYSGVCKCVCEIGNGSHH